MQSAIVTVPSGLKIAIDGTSAWAGYNFVWGEGRSIRFRLPPRRWIPAAEPGNS